jgi:hypothetical protein
MESAKLALELRKNLSEAERRLAKVNRELEEALLSGADETKLDSFYIEAQTAQIDIATYQKKLEELPKGALEAARQQTAATWNAVPAKPAATVQEDEDGEPDPVDDEFEEDD